MHVTNCKDNSYYLECTEEKSDKEKYFFTKGEEEIFSPGDKDEGDEAEDVPTNLWCSMSNDEKEKGSRVKNYYFMASNLTLSRHNIMEKEELMFFSNNLSMKLCVRYLEHITCTFSNGLDAFRFNCASRKQCGCHELYLIIKENIKEKKLRTDGLERENVLAMEVRTLVDDRTV